MRKEDGGLYESGGVDLIEGGGGDSGVIGHQVQRKECLQFLDSIH